MKVQELRDLLKGRDKAVVEKAFVECYKLIPKKQKDETDQVIKDVLEGKTMVRKKTTLQEVDFEALESRIMLFIQNAREGNYYMPNRVIPKNQRSKWRFLVRDFIKSLDGIAPENENHERAAVLLKELYKLMCSASEYYIFSTEDPFRSIGWEQPDLYHMIAEKQFVSGYTREKVSEMILLACCGGLSRESVHLSQEQRLLSVLRTPEVRSDAAEEVTELVKSMKEKMAGLKEHDRRMYELEDTINNFCDMFLMLKISTGEVLSGAQYYFKNHCSFSKEVTMYCALMAAEAAGENSDWIQIYEYAVSKKITPRSYIKEEYEKRLREQEEEEM